MLTSDMASKLAIVKSMPTRRGSPVGKGKIRFEIDWRYRWCGLMCGDLQMCGQ